MEEAKNGPEENNDLFKYLEISGRLVNILTDEPLKNQQSVD